MRSLRIPGFILVSLSAAAPACADTADPARGEGEGRLLAPASEEVFQPAGEKAGLPGDRDPGVGRNVRCNGDAGPAAQNEPAIAWDQRTGHLVVGANDFRGVPEDAPVGVYVSSDRGASFSDDILPGLTVAHGGDYQEAGDPSIACSGRGDCYYAAIVFDWDTYRSGVAVVHSDSGGVKWDRPVFPAQSDDPSVFHDKEWIGVDDRTGDVHLVWTEIVFDQKGQYQSAPLYIASSTDHGVTWTAPRRISPGDQIWNQSPHVVAAPDGAVHVAYESWLESGPGRHVIQTSRDRGETFSDPVLIIDDVADNPSPLPEASYRVDSSPWLAVNPVTGTLHLVWSDFRLGRAAVWATASLDGGATWIEQRLISDLPSGTTAHDIMPAVACGPTGACGVAFYSTRAAAFEGFLDVYFTPIHVSTSPERPPSIWTGKLVRVTDFSSNPEIQFGGTFFGDYIGLAIDAGPTAHPVWTDTRLAYDGGEEPVPQQDIFTAAVKMSQPEIASEK